MAVATMSGCTYLISAFEDKIIATLGSEADTSGGQQCFRDGRKDSPRTLAQASVPLCARLHVNLLIATHRPPLLPGEPLKPAFSHDGKHLVSGTRDGHLHIWDAENGSEMARLAGGHGRRSRS